MAAVTQAQVEIMIEQAFERYDARIGEIMSRADAQLEQVRSAAVSINNTMIDLSEQTRGMGDRVAEHENKLMCDTFHNLEHEIYLQGSFGPFKEVLQVFIA